MYRQAWETQDGQKWLAKALDPAGMETVDVKGLPDQESHNVVVLNYQSQYSIDPPNMFGVEANDGATYDSEMFFFQDPIVFGTAATFPTGTKDPMWDSKSVIYHFGSVNTGGEARPSITFNGSGIVFPRTCKRFVNSQLNGARNITTAYDALKGVAQRHRMIYGATQLIPTCSYEDNSGSISISQAPFVGDSFNHTVIGGKKCTDLISTMTAANYGAFPSTSNSLSIYQPNDFPDTEDNIRNPASLLTRFYEGAYIPYKLKNPFQEDFISTADAQVTAAPFWVIGAYAQLGRLTGGSLVMDSDYTEMVWDQSIKAFLAPNDSNNNNYYCCQRLKLRLMSRTGAIKEIIFYHDATLDKTSADYTGTVDLSAISGTRSSDSLAGVYSVLSSLPQNEYNKGLLADNNSFDYYITGTGSKLFLYRAGVGLTLPNGTVSTTETEDCVRSRMPTSNIAACLCKSMNMKGNIALLVRMGVEIVVTGYSTYSPFNHKSPAYDESAIKSYLRVIHGISDAFYGNSAVGTFHTAYYNYLISRIYNANDDIDYANRGSYWRGVISATR